MMKVLLFDALMEFAEWLIDRKNYKKRAVSALKMTFGIIAAALIFGAILFIVLIVVYLCRPTAG